jgi:hypothetical protein
MSQTSPKQNDMNASSTNGLAKAERKATMTAHFSTSKE